MDFSEVTLQYNYTDRHTPLWHPFLNYSSDFVKLFQGYGLYTVGDVGFLSNDQVCVCVCVCNWRWSPVHWHDRLYIDQSR